MRVVTAEAEGLLYSLLKAPGPVTAAAIGAFNALLQVRRRGTQLR